MKFNLWPCFWCSVFTLQNRLCRTHSRSSPFSRCACACYSVSLTNELLAIYLAYRCAHLCITVCVLYIWMGNVCTLRMPALMCIMYANSYWHNGHNRARAHTQSYNVRTGATKKLYNHSPGNGCVSSLTRLLVCSLFRLHYLTRLNDFMPYFEVHIANEVSHFADTTPHIQLGNIQAVFVIATHNFCSSLYRWHLEK